MTYNWIISGLDTAPQEGSLSDIVKIVHWRYEMIDGVDKVDVFGAYNCPFPSEVDFTNYANLTKEQIIGWLVLDFATPLHEGGSKTKMEFLLENLQQKMDYIKNPSTLNKPLPF